MAQVAQITPTYVWRLETGKAAPGIDLIERLAKGLQTTIADLIPEQTLRKPKSYSASKPANDSKNCSKRRVTKLC